MSAAVKRFAAVLAVSVVCVVSASPAVAADSSAESKPTPGTFASDVRPLLNKYCVRCHGSKQQKGERRFDKLNGELPDDNALVDLQDVLDQLNLGEMPPKKAAQPTNEDRRRATAWLTRRIDQFHKNRKASDGSPVLRRLNSREYGNTVRDLLNLDMTMFDPTAAFPRDQTSEHLDNVGDTLVTSGHLLARYLEAADQVIRKAIGPLKEPATQTWAFRDGFRQQPEIDQVFRTVGKFEYMTLFDVVGADKHEGAYGPIHAFAAGVPHDGIYEIRLKAEALNRLNPYDADFLGVDPSEPLRLGIVAGNRLVGALHKPQPIEPLLAEIELADKEQWYTVRVRLDAGFTPRFTFRNGLMDARNLWAKILRKYPKLHPKPERGGIVGHRYTAIKYGKLPQIRIQEIEIEGPFFDQWPTQSQTAVFGEHAGSYLSSGSMTPKQIRAALRDFATRAYRRSATSEEVDRLMQVVDARRKAGSSSIAAYADGLKAALCSPGFLYLEETDAGQATSTALSTRLAYFLWSSTPDVKLSDIAASGRLRELEILKAQIDRMLNDPKSGGFIDGFLGSWLTLRDLGSTPPDRNQFRSFYHYDLDHAMRQETHLFTRRLLDENLSIVNFLDSDFTYVNKPLARHYGLEPPKGNGFRLVALTDRRRGGLLGQSSVLTVTANGIDTSPVVRGVWLLENLLGTPPSPPPPDVEPLDPDIRGAKTIRDQLKKHRDVPSCNDCHRRIDPLGFALENFDPIGKWRSSYGKQGTVDASGELPDGQAFDDITELKRMLVERKDQFALALTRKLLEYATGRHMQPADRPHIDAVTRKLADRGYGFRDLIHLVVMSEPFRRISHQSATP